MRAGYYWLAKSEEPLSQDSPEVVKFFEELIENDMIEFSEPKKESSLVGRHNTKELRSFTDKAKTFGKHVDDLDVYFLQAIGETQFTGPESSMFWMIKSIIRTTSWM